MCVCVCMCRHNTDILTRAVEARVARCRDKIGKGKKGGEII